MWRVLIPTSNMMAEQNNSCMFIVRLFHVRKKRIFSGITRSLNKVHFSILNRIRRLLSMYPELTSLVLLGGVLRKFCHSKVICVV